MPAGPLDSKTLHDHCRELERLTGPGRDGDVAVIKMAAAGFACRKLHSVIAELNRLGPDETDSSSADELVEYAMSAPHHSSVADSLRRWADEDGVPIEHQALEDMIPLEPDLSEVRARAALLPIAQAVVHESVEPEVLQEFDELLNQPLSRMAGEEVGFDGEMQKAMSILINRIAFQAETAINELDSLSSEELIRGVQAADHMLQAISINEISIAADEERWRWVGRLAPIAPLVLDPLRELLIRHYEPIFNEAEISDQERSFVEAIMGRGLRARSRPPTAIEASAEIDPPT